MTLASLGLAYFRRRPLLIFSAVAIALGVAVLFAVLAVMNGFLAELQSSIRTISGDAAIDISRSRGGEFRPLEAYEEGEEHGERARDGAQAGLLSQESPGVVEAQQQAVQRSPGDEGPGRAVPEAAEQHGDHQVHIGHDPSPPVPSQRDIEIILEPAGKGDMPSFPEITHTGGFVGGIEILRQAKAQQRCHHGTEQSPS